MNISEGAHCAGSLIGVGSGAYRYDRIVPMQSDIVYSTIVLLRPRTIARNAFNPRDPECKQQ